MQTSLEVKGVMAWLVVGILGAIAPLEGCTSTRDPGDAGIGGSGGVAAEGGVDTIDAGSDAPGEGHDSTHPGASFSCTAQTAATSATCTVGQSYCVITTGGAGGAGGSQIGPYTTAFCAMIPEGTACAANPTCACVCALRGCGSGGCTCRRDTDGLVELSCMSV